VIVPDVLDADLEKGGVPSPVIVCDSCGGRVIGTCTVHWLELATGDLHPAVWHAHEGICSGRVEHAITRSLGGVVMSEELHRWLGDLRGSAAPSAPPSKSPPHNSEGRP
jgi:hypothetical protein